MKDECLAQLVALVMMKRERVPLKGDLLLLAVSDEEVNGSGTDWFISHHRDLLGHAEFLINEGGENLVEDGKVKFVGVEVGEKSTFWVHVVAHGRAGHGSRPIVDSAPDRLVEALARILQYPTPLKVLPVVEEFLREMVPYELPERARLFRNVRQAVQDTRFQDEVEHDESLNYMLRDTISLTMLGGSEQTNVIPPEAWANLDVRLLPGEDPRNFLESIRQTVADPNVTVMPLLYQAIREVSAHYFPGVLVLPRLSSGYTDSQRYRPLAIAASGASHLT